MDPSHHILTLSPQPPDLLARLRPVLAAQGSPPISVTGQGDVLAFSSQTGEFMLRARVADALTAVCEDWQSRVTSPLR